MVESPDREVVDGLKQSVKSHATFVSIIIVVLVECNWGENTWEEVEDRSIAGK